jgi:hypothetical protein
MILKYLISNFDHEWNIEKANGTGEMKGNKKLKERRRLVLRMKRKK